MSNSTLRRFSKPAGYDSRFRDPANKSSTEEPRSLIAARSRAARLNVSLGEMLRQDRERLRASTYPGPECLEPYEVEQYAAGRLSPERAEHIEACSGCQVLVGGVVPLDDQVSAFLEEMEETEPGSEAFRVPRREFWFDVVSVPAAAGTAVFVGYALLRFVGPTPTDSLLRAAVLSQFMGVAGRFVGASSLVCVIGLIALILAYGRKLLEASGGTLASGAALGLLLVAFGWIHVHHTAQTMRAAVTLNQVQFTGTVAASLGPGVLTESSFDLRQVRIPPSPSIIKVAAFQPEQHRLEFKSYLDGLPGSMVAEIAPNGGDVYWDVAKEKEPLGKILFGTVESSSADKFVLTDSGGQAHTLNKNERDVGLTNGSEVMVLLNSKNGLLLAVHALNPTMKQTTAQ